MLIFIIAFIQVWSDTLSVSVLSPQKLSIYGDFEYMKEQNLKPYPQSSLRVVSSLVKEDEAEVLPPKLKVDLTNV